ncbi:MAG: hypothetical protein ACAI44_05455 [Candidatus Sericytochromatia bacterium]
MSISVSSPSVLIGATPVQTATRLGQPEATFPTRSAGADRLEIQTGLKTGLLGAGAGALTAGAGMGLGFKGMLCLVGDFGGDLLAPAFPMVIGGAALTGGIAGAAVSQLTESKLAGSALGALLGAATGAVVLTLVTRDPSLAKTGAVFGGLAGTLGGFSGAVVARHIQ